MTPAERRQLAWAMFTSIPWEHRLGVRILRGATWGGAFVSTTANDHARSWKPSTQYLDGDYGGFGRHDADKE